MVKELLPTWLSLVILQQIPRMKFQVRNVMPFGFFGAKQVEVF